MKIVITNLIELAKVFLQFKFFLKPLQIYEEFFLIQICILKLLIFENFTNQSKLLEN